MDEPQSLHGTIPFPGTGDPGGRAMIGCRLLRSRDKSSIDQLCSKHVFNLSFNHSFNHSLTHSFNHSLTHSFNHSLTHSFNHSFNHSLTHSLTHSFNHSLTHSFNHMMLLSLLSFQHQVLHLRNYHRIP